MVRVRRLGDVEIASSGYTSTPAKTRPFAFASELLAFVAGNRVKGRPRVRQEYFDGVDNRDGIHLLVSQEYLYGVDNRDGVHRLINAVNSDIISEIIDRGEHVFCLIHIVGGQLEEVFFSKVKNALARSLGFLEFFQSELRVEGEGGEAECP